MIPEHQGFWRRTVRHMLPSVSLLNSTSTPTSNVGCGLQVEAFLKFVRYPQHSMPTRSALFTPGNENTWPKLLGVLDWVVSYLNYRDKAAASPKGWHASADPATASALCLGPRQSQSLLPAEFTLNLPFLPSSVAISTPPDVRERRCPLQSSTGAWVGTE